MGTLMLIGAVLLVLFGLALLADWRRRGNREPWKLSRAPGGGRAERNATGSTVARTTPVGTAAAPERRLHVEAAMFWIGVAVVAVVLFAVAWWTSGRAKGRSLSSSALTKGQTAAMRHYRPPQNPAGPNTGSSI
jgi:hypothetical protein